MKNNISRVAHFVLLFLVCCLFLSACLSKERQPVRKVAKPLDLNSPMEQGLESYYRFSFYRHIDQMPGDESMVAEGQKGKAVPYLDHRFKESVFDSNKEKGVGVLLKGYLKIQEAGTYAFKAMSNDGIRVLVNGVEVGLDPTVHSDRFSPEGHVTIDQPGWYPLTVKYFQRKGTARLELYWQPPGSENFEIIPAAAYGHVGEGSH